MTFTATFTSEQQVVSTLEATFAQVQQRMDGLPFLNPRLQVRALGFQPWQQYWLGVMVTPWFMNFMLLPREDGVSVPRFGEAQSVNFPCGSFSFIAGHEGGIGRYLSCSLLSPVQELESQHLAEEIAMASLKQLLTAEASTAESSIPADCSAEPPRRTLFRRILGQQTDKQPIQGKAAK
tara:strand:- start:7269 stop:7805 length:537 start_codon:yes stop_codon:yes gene_type:complete